MPHTRWVLRGSPPFALLVAETWNAVGDRQRGGAATKISSLAIPVLMAFGVLFVIPRVAPDHSHHALVAQYNALRASDAEQLVYVNEAPQSAELYAGGKFV